MEDITKQVPTPHNGAKVGDIAKTVLMPGDPLRAKYLAERFLEQPVCFNTVRGMLGYTGRYRGVKVSVMGSGMGMPSMGIYSHELYALYGVENIIRIGSCGAFDPDVKVFDIIVATEAHSESSFLKALTGEDDTVLYPSESLNELIKSKAYKLRTPIINAPIMSGDVFYNMRPNYFEHEMAISGAVAGEMEAFALFANAKVLGKQAACILTVSDNIATGQQIPAADREKSLKKMMELALSVAIDL